MGNARLALALLPFAAIMLTACTAESAASTGPTSSAPSTTTPAPTSTSAATSTSTATPVRTATSSPAQPKPAVCQPQTLKFEPGTKSTAGTTFTVTTAVKNTGASTCAIQGYPQVAITGLPPATGDWPRKQLTVKDVGPSYPVTLVPGDGAMVTLTFNQCQAGQTPTRGPVALLGVPDGGTELTLEDGSDFVECGDVVQVTAFEAHLP